LYDFTKAFSFLPLPKGTGALIIESTGGAGILAADMCEKLGLSLPELNPSVKEKLQNALPSYCTFSNPFDLTTAAFKAELFRLVIEENMDSDSFHAFIVIFGDPIPNAAEEIRRATTRTRKPILVSYLGGSEIELAETAKMHSMGIPVFPSPERAVRALWALVRYSERVESRHR
jgi:acyl-CoA synthetase (NDP forming)